MVLGKEPTSLSSVPPEADARRVLRSSSGPGLRPSGGGGVRGAPEHVAPSWRGRERPREGSRRQAMSRTEGGAVGQGRGMCVWDDGGPRITVQRACLSASLLGSFHEGFAHSRQPCWDTRPPRPPQSRSRRLRELLHVPKAAQPGSREALAQPATPHQRPDCRGRSVAGPCGRPRGTECSPLTRNITGQSLPSPQATVPPPPGWTAWQEGDGGRRHRAWQGSSRPWPRLLPQPWTECAPQAQAEPEPSMAARRRRLRHNGGKRGHRPPQADAAHTAGA